jgi:alkylhydroperoxidase family enzyme
VAISEGRWREIDSLGERDRGLCEVAERMSRQPTSMTEQDWQPLRRLGFTDEMILEVAHVVGIFNHLTRLADGLGLQLDPQTEQAARTGVPLKRVVPAATEVKG